MNFEHLVTMANDFGAFFDGESGIREAPQGLSQSALAAVRCLPEPVRR